MTQRLVALIVTSSLLLLGACQGYDFKVNDKVVYSPAPLFTAFQAPDTALYTCLEQAIVDAEITAAEQLTALNCSHAGIENLEGLATFTGLKALRLSSNRVRNLVEISQLAALEELYLEDNRVIDPVPLYRLPTLRTVDLSGNTDLQCPRQGGLKQVEQLALPGHCL